jgi:hypothetical protein
MIAAGMNAAAAAAMSFNRIIVSFQNDAPTTLKCLAMFLFLLLMQINHCIGVAMRHGDGPARIGAARALQSR